MPKVHIVSQFTDGRESWRNHREAEQLDLASGHELPRFLDRVVVVPAGPHPSARTLDLRPLGMQDQLLLRDTQRGSCGMEYVATQ